MHRKALLSSAMQMRPEILMCNEEDIPKWTVGDEDLWCTIRRYVSSLRDTQYLPMLLGYRCAKKTVRKCIIEVSKI